jgi:hypothetical protein
MSMLTTQRDTVSKRGGIVALGILVMTAIFAIVLSPTRAFADETVDVPVSTVWDDGNDNYGNRPDAVTYRLYAIPRALLSEDGHDDSEFSEVEPTLVSTKEALRADDYATTFEDMRTHDDSGNELAYYVDYAPVPGYSDYVAYRQETKWVEREDGEYDKIPGYTLFDFAEFDGESPVCWMIRPLYGYWFGAFLEFNDAGHEDERPESVTIRVCEEGSDETITKFTLSADQTSHRTSDAIINQFTWPDQDIYLEQIEKGIDYWYGYSKAAENTEDPANTSVFADQLFPKYRNGKPVTYTFRADGDLPEVYDFAVSNFFEIATKECPRCAKITLTYMEPEDSSEDNNLVEEPETETPTPEEETPATPSAPTPSTPSTPRPIEKKDIPQLGADLPAGIIVTAGILVASAVGYAVSRRMRH